MVNDPIGDLLIQIKNASLAGKPNVELPYSRLKMAVSQVLKEEGYVADAVKIGESPKARLRLSLKYDGKVAAISDVKRKSKPGLRLYIPQNAIPTVVGGMGTAILSTSKGVMTGKEARKRGLGGELLCEIW